MTKEEFDICVDSFYDRIYNLVKSRLYDKESAEDIAQETYSILWKKRKKVKLKQAKPYIYSIVHNLIMKEIDYRRKVNELRKVEQSSKYNDLRVEDKDLLDKIMQNLKPEWRECLMLSDWEGFTYSEIAEIMHISVTDVKNYIFRAKVHIKQTIKER